MKQDDDLSLHVDQTDDVTFAAFFNEHRPKLLKFVERNLGPRLKQKVDSEDILQEVYVSVMKGGIERQPEGKSTFSWLCKMAERRIIDSHRKYIQSQKRSATREVMIGTGAAETNAAGLANLLISSITSPSLAVSREQQQQRLEQALLTLKADEQEVIRLRFVENLPSKEIAKRVDKTDGAVRVMLTRIVKRLEEALVE